MRFAFPGTRRHSPSETHFPRPSFSQVNPIHLSVTTERSGAFQVSLGDFSITAFGGGRAVGGLALCLDVSESNLLYQVFHAIAREVPATYGFSDTNIVIYDPAVGGVIPPFDQLRENYFNVDLASGGSESDFATGHLTSFPVVRRTPGNSVPESGSPPGVIRLGTSRL